MSAAALRAARPTRSGEASVAQVAGNSNPSPGSTAPPVQDDARGAWADAHSSGRPPRPVAPAPAFDSIPVELRREARWVVWRYEWRDDGKGGGTWAKVPYRASADRRGKASSIDSETWATYEAAQDAYEHTQRARRTPFDGVGFVLGDGFVGVDVDDCRDPRTGELTTEAREILSTLNTYAEASPSGTGVHAIARGELPTGGNRRGHVEMCAIARYFTMTGAHL